MIAAVGQCKADDSAVYSTPITRFETCITLKKVDNWDVENSKLFEMISKYRSSLAVIPLISRVAEFTREVFEKLTNRLSSEQLEWGQMGAILLDMIRECEQNPTANKRDIIQLAAWNSFRTSYNNFLRSFIEDLDTEAHMAREAARNAQGAHEVAADEQDAGLAAGLANVVRQQLGGQQQAVGGGEVLVCNRIELPSITDEIFVNELVGGSGQFSSVFLFSCSFFGPCLPFSISSRAKPLLKKFSYRGGNGGERWLVTVYPVECCALLAISTRERGFQIH